MNLTQEIAKLKALKIQSPVKPLEILVKPQQDDFLARLL
jgi:hypothetical protein